MAQTLTITYSGGTLNLIDGTNYAVVRDGWAPTVAPLRETPIGGVGPYADVAEEITLNVRGATAATVYANVAALAQALDEADRWWRGDYPSGVYLRYQVGGGSGTNLFAAIKGRASGDETAGVKLTITYDSAAIIYYTTLTMRFIRYGLWLQNPETATSATVTQPAIMSASLATYTPLSPCKITISGFDGNTADLPFKSPESWFVWSYNGGLQVIEGESYAGGAGVSTVADSTNFASNGSVARFTGTSGVINYGSTTYTVTGRRLMILAAMRNTSANDGLVTARGRVTGNYVSTRTIVVKANTNPAIYNFGTIAFGIGARLDYLDFLFSASASTTIDIDYWVLVDVSDSTIAGAVRIIHNMYNTTDTFGAGAISVNINPGWSDDSLTRPTQSVLMSGFAASGGASVSAYQGMDGAPSIATRGNGFTALFLATGGQSAAHWRFTNTSNIVQTVSMTVSRTRSYLVPQ